MADEALVDEIFDEVEKDPRVWDMSKEDRIEFYEELIERITTTKDAEQEEVDRE